jgi:hypothetical protein
MNTVWRFYVDSAGKWRWETRTQDALTPVGSSRSFDTLQECQEAAEKSGYRYQVAQPHLPRTPSVPQRKMRR